MRRRRVGVLALVVAGVLLVPATPSAAETTVKVDGNVLRITIKVDIFAGENVRAAPDGRPLDEYWEEILNNTWGEAFNRLSFKNCFKLELDLDLELRDINDRPRRGRHQIFVGTETRGWRGVGWDRVPESKRDPDTGDGIDSYEDDRQGDIPANAPPIVVAHEFGHIMGLGDDRENGVAKNTRDGTVMVGGAKGVDPYAPYQPSMIDKDLIDRLGKVVEDALEDNHEKAPKCEEWTGKLTSEHSIPVTPCTHTWSGTFEFGVVEDQVLGSATVSPGGCGGIAGPVTITGTADDAGFTLSSDSYLLAAGTRAEKTAPDRAEGTSEYHDAYNDVITTFEMECKKNCDEEPVG